MKKHIILVASVVCLVLLFSGCVTNIDRFEDISEDLGEALEDLGENMSDAFDDIGKDMSTPDETDEDFEYDINDALWESAVGRRLANFDSSSYDGGDKFPRQSEYGEGQCTWYCYGRALEKLGKEITFDGSGAAELWLDNVNNCGESKDDIHEDSIAVSKSIGHVIYVEYIDGDTVYYSEVNYDENGKIDEDDGKIQSDTIEHFIQDRNIDGFIYLL